MKKNSKYPQIYLNVSNTMSKYVISSDPARNKVGNRKCVIQPNLTKNFTKYKSVYYLYQRPRTWARTRRSAQSKTTNKSVYNLQHGPALGRQQ